MAVTGLSDQIDGWSVQFYLLTEVGKGRWEKKLVPQLGIETLPFACEASALTTEPPWPVVLEVTRMPIYNNALGSVPTQYFLLFKYLIPTFFFLFPFCFSFYLLPPFLLPFFPFVLLTSPFFFLFSFFFSFFSSYFFPFFIPFSLPPFYLVCPTNHL